MGQILPGCARTTTAVRRAIQHSQESLRTLANRHGSTLNRRQVEEEDLGCGSEDRAGAEVDRSLQQEAVVVAFRRHTLLPLDDCLYALQATISELTRSSLHRCLQRHHISRLTA